MQPALCSQRRRPLLVREVHGATPQHGGIGAAARVDEILAWLAAQRPPLPPACAWLAVDDLELHASRPDLNAAHFELTDDAEGLLRANVPGGRWRSRLDLGESVPVCLLSR